MKTRTFYLPDQQIEKLDALVKATGLSMAEHVRRAIDDYLNRTHGDWTPMSRESGK